MWLGLQTYADMQSNKDLTTSMRCGAAQSCTRMDLKYIYRPDVKGYKFSNNTLLVIRIFGFACLNHIAVVQALVRESCFMF